MTSFSLRTLCILACWLVLSCRKDPAIPPREVEIKTYLHLSHTRTNSNSKVDSLVKTVDYRNFDMLWLGGDLAFLTSGTEAAMQRVDSIFFLGKSSTLWALGNHDYTNLARVEAYTHRPRYYAVWQDGMTIVVLDTQENLSAIDGEQLSFFNSVLDTVSVSSHLVILHHKLIWMYGNEFLEPQIEGISNAGLGTCEACLNPNNFQTEIYPRLVEKQNSGIDVICVGGDVGFKTGGFEHQTPEGIWFLASGIKSGEENSKALLFEHNLTERTLSWHFILLKDL